jgi:hypothetical protein
MIHMAPDASVYLHNMAHPIKMPRYGKFGDKSIDFITIYETNLLKKKL